MPAATAARQTALKRLAGALAFLCLVLALLALEQRHTVAAWEFLRDAGGRLVTRVLQSEAEPSPPAAPASSAVVLAGRFAPADDATRSTTGAVAFVAAQLQFDSGEGLSTRPLRIARAGEAFAAGHTWAARLAVTAEAQIELRDVTGSSADRLCGGAPVKVAALLHRGTDVQLMLFRTRPESDASSDILCGVWSYTAQ